MTSFADSMEDFGLSAAKEKEQSEASESAEEEVDTSIALQPEELEALKHKAFEEGKEKGRAEVQKELSEQMADSMKLLFSFVSEEGERRSELLTQITDMFTELMYETVKELVAGELKRDVIRRDMLKDIASFAKECEGEVQISCAKSNAAPIQKALADLRGITVVVDPALRSGQVKVSSSTVEITMDKNEWVNAARDRVLSSVQNIIHLRKQNARARS